VQSAAGVFAITAQLCACMYVNICYLITLLQIEHLKACLEIATSRTINWQQFCQRDEGPLDISLFSVTMMFGL